MPINFDMGSQRGTTPKKDVMVHDGDLWRDYKRTRAHDQGRKVLVELGDKERFVILR
jgi:hypothetical protein